MATHDSHLTDALRSASAWIARRSTAVRVLEDRIDAYAARLLERSIPSPARSAPLAGAARERGGAYWLTLDAINFGSGWFPTLSKRSERTGYRTISAGITRRFEAHGGWSAAELMQLSAV